MIRRPPRSTLFPYTTSSDLRGLPGIHGRADRRRGIPGRPAHGGGGVPCAEKSVGQAGALDCRDRKSTRLNSSHLVISYAVFCLKKKNKHSRVSTSRPQSHHR